MALYRIEIFYVWFKNKTENKVVCAVNMLHFDHYFQTNIILCEKIFELFKIKSSFYKHFITLK